MTVMRLLARNGPETNPDNFRKLGSASRVAPKRAPSKVVVVKETYRGYEVEVEPDGAGQYLSARPLHPELPILSRVRMKVLCTQERALEILRIAVDRLLDKL